MKFTFLLLLELITATDLLNYILFSTAHFWRLLHKVDQSCRVHF